MYYFKNQVMKLVKKYNPKMRTPVGPEIPTAELTKDANATHPLANLTGLVFDLNADTYTQDVKPM